MYYIHRQIILQKLGYRSFGDDERTVLLREAKRLAHLQVKPANIFDSCVFFLREKRIETPQYTTMHNLIHAALAQYENDLEKILATHLRLEDKNLLDELLQKGNDIFERYGLTNYKKIPQSMKPSVIKHRVELFIWFKRIVGQLEPLIARLNLSDATVRYYAQYVLDTRSANVARRGSDKYLLLIAFVIHQYLCLGDSLALTLIHAATTCINGCENRSKEILYQQRHHTAALVGKVTDRNKVHLSVIGIIEHIAYDEALDDGAKINRIKDIIRDKKITRANLDADLQQVDSLRAAQLKSYGEQEFYTYLEKESILLQKRLSPLLQHIVFDENSSQRDIYDAVKYFQLKKGEVIQGNQLPIGFLSMDERMVLYTPNGKLKTSLYKALLFKEVVLQIKAGALNILSSPTITAPMSST